MRYSFLLALAIAAVVSGQVAAQTSPDATPSAPTTSPSGPGGVVNDGLRAGSPPMRTGAASFISRQASDQWLASGLLSKDVHGVDGKAVGPVKDLLVDRTGNVSAIVVGVGEFLGIGEKNVAVPFSSIEVRRDQNNNDRLVLLSTRSDLREAPAFSPIEERGTFGAGSSGSSDERESQNGSQGGSRPKER